MTFGTILYKKFIDILMISCYYIIKLKDIQDYNDYSILNYKESINMTLKEKVLKGIELTEDELLTLTWCDICDVGFTKVQEIEFPINDDFDEYRITIVSTFDNGNKRYFSVKWIRDTDDGEFNNQPVEVFPIEENGVVKYCKLQGGIFLNDN